MSGIAPPPAMRRSDGTRFGSVRAGDHVVEDLRRVARAGHERAPVLHRRDEAHLQHRVGALAAKVDVVDELGVRAGGRGEQERCDEGVG